MAYAILLYAAKIITGDTRPPAGPALRMGKARARYFPLLIGYAALILLGKIPVVGFLINVVLLCPAMGAVFLAIHRWRRQSAQPTLIE